MAVVTKYGTGYKDPAAIRQVEAVFAEASLKSIRSQVTITSGDSIASKYYIGKIPSNAIIDPRSMYAWQAVTGVTSLDIGFANDPNALVAADDVSLAGTQTLQGHGTLSVPNMNKKAWELAGLTADPGGLLDLFATINAAATATAIVQFVFDYSKIP